MRALFAAIERGSIWILLVTVILVLAASLRFADLGYSDDVTRFLPEGDPEVAQFTRIGNMFGGLNIAIVGLDTTEAGGDIFTPQRIDLLVDLSDKLRQVPGVRAVSSLATARDSRERTLPSGEIEVVVEDVIPAVPDSQVDADDLRRRVLGAPHLVGSFVSPDGRAALILCNLDDRISALDTAALIRTEVETRQLAERGLEAHLGGAPFISEGLARAAEDDLMLLGPLVALTILLIVFFSFGSIRAALLAIIPVGAAIVLTMGFMAAVGEPLTLISSSLPIVLLALGSAYPVHVVTHALRAASESGVWNRETIRTALERVGPPVLGAGVTTMIAFLSFLAMNLEPMRKFGLFMALGTLISTAMAVLVLPAAMLHIKLRPPTARGRIGARPVMWLQRCTTTLDRHARATLAVVLLVVIAGTVGVTFVRTDMSTSSYFTRETDTVRADHFLEDRFGGSLYLQIVVEGDVRDPLVLDEIARLEDFLATLEGVSDVRSVTEVIRIANRSLFGSSALPRRREQVMSLATLADDDPAVRMLVTRDWDAALVQVRLGGFDADAAEVLAERVREYVQEQMPRASSAVSWRTPTTSPDTIALALARAARSLTTVLYDSTEFSPARHNALTDAIARGLSAERATPGEDFPDDLRRTLERHLNEHELIYLEGGPAALPRVVDEFLAAMEREVLLYETAAEILFAHADAEERDAVTEARAAGKSAGGFERAVGTIHRSVRELQDSVVKEALLGEVRAVTTDVASVWDDPVRGERAEQILADLLDDLLFLPHESALELPEEILRSTATTAAVSGYPVLWAGMNASIRANQVKSVTVSIVVILFVLTVIFRSVIIGLAAMLPTALTLVVAFGILGLSGTPIDMGSTMITSIAFGVGIDYAIHFLWAYRRRLADGRREAGFQAIATAGPSIVVNALEVGLAFGILAFGTVAPMSRFGVLTGETMLLAAGATLFLLPPLLWRLNVPMLK